MKRLVFTTLSGILSLCLFISCSKSSETQLDPPAWEETWVVASKLVPGGPENESPPCLWVKRPSSEDWEMFRTRINGFEYEKGYEYNLLLSISFVKNPPMDASSKNYTLVKVLSKEEKDSDVPLLSR